MVALSPDICSIHHPLQALGDHVDGSELRTVHVWLDRLEHLNGSEARLVNALLFAVLQDLTRWLELGGSDFG